MTDRETIEQLSAVLAELIASIDKRWEGETERKREAAVSPRTEDAMEAGRSLLASIGSKSAA